MLTPIRATWPVSSFDESGGPWQPLLAGDLRLRALEAVADIADSLAALPAAAGYNTDLALFFAYLAQAQKILPAPITSISEPEALAQHFAAKSLEQVAAAEMRAGLYGGLAGVGWMLAHLAKHTLDLDPDDDPNTAITEVLFDYAAQTPWTEDYDLMPMYRIGRDLWALGNKDLFESFIEAYQEDSGVEINRDLDVVFVTYAASIMVSYLFSLQKTDPDKRAAAEKFHSFVRFLLTTNT